MNNTPTPTASVIADALALLTPFSGRRPTTSEDDMGDTFAVLAETAECGVYAGSFQGESAWERHANGDELVQILDGATRIRILGADGGETVLDMTKGMVTIVPRGSWHKFIAETNVTVMTMTPAPTDHSAADDPRTEQS